MDALKETFFSLALRQAAVGHHNALDNQLRGELNDLHFAHRDQEAWPSVLREGLAHESPSVQLWSAVYLLRYDEVLASARLGHLAGSDLPVAAEARQLLAWWKAGLFEV